MAGFADCIMVASSKMMQSMMQEEENFKPCAVLSRLMAEDLNLNRCVAYDCEAVISPKTAVVVSYGDDGTANCLCDCCAITAGYLRP